MSNVVIFKSNFKIERENVKPALDAVLRKYPYAESVSKMIGIASLDLQYVLYALGYHSRVHQGGSMFGITKVGSPFKINSKPIDADPDELFSVLEPFVAPNTKIELSIAGIRKSITLNEHGEVVNKVKSREEIAEDIIHSIQDIEDVAEEIADEIVPETFKMKSMDDFVKDAIAEVNVEKYNEEQAKNTTTVPASKKTTRKVKKPSAAKNVHKK